MSEVKVNKISPRSGTDVTLGDSGDTFTIPSGATINNQGTAVNFGATGSASWVTTVKTSTFTAVAGEGYFINTTGGVVTVNLPAGTAGAVVAVKDYAGTFDTNAVTLVQNGSDKIGGSTVNATLSTEGIAVTLVFVDSTQGWLVTDDGLQSQAVTNPNLIATGGTITECGNFKIHTFTGPGTFTVCKVSATAAENTVGYLVVAGGGSGGGGDNSGGGGSGGFREGRNVPIDNFTASPLVANAPTNALTVTAGAIPITVGGGGTGSPGAIGVSGSNSIFSTITAAGGGGGGTGSGPTGDGLNGGSGGGGGHDTPGPLGGAGGTGNTPPTTPAQGFNGGTGSPGGPQYVGGGGGGSSAVGANGSPSGGGPGGNGVSTSITGAGVARGGGGGGGSEGLTSPGGTGGGGDGRANATVGCNGTDNTGGGGGGTGSTTGGNGGSGIVIIRYKFQ